MKTKWVAILHARKFIAASLKKITWGAGLLMSLLFLVNSCSKSDELDTSDNGIPIEQESLIIYTDIEPDFVSENLNDFYDLDLNNDQIADYTLISTKEYNNNEYLSISSFSNSDNGIISIALWDTHPIPLDRGSLIFNIGNTTTGEGFESWGFFTIGNCFEGGEICYENWKDKNDKYLGLRLIINGKTHYGWARMSVVSNTQWVIKDYAYNATPNKVILAGLTE